MVEILYLLNGAQELRDLVKYNMPLEDVIAERKKVFRTASKIAQVEYIVLLCVLLIILSAIILSITPMIIIFAILAGLIVIGRVIARKVKGDVMIRHYAEVYKHYGVH